MNNMKYIFRQATEEDAFQIWKILEKAIKRRKDDGSTQWQDGYPNQSIVENDIKNSFGYVLVDEDIIIGYCAILINDEPEYSNIKGSWLTNGDFVVYHRVAISEKYLGQGLAQSILQHIEDFALKHNIYSVKVDTNFDNRGMLWVLQKMCYHYCGEVTFRGSPRKAFEKILR